MRGPRPPAPRRVACRAFIDTDGGEVIVTGDVLRRCARRRRGRRGRRPARARARPTGASRCRWRPTGRRRRPHGGARVDGQRWIRSSCARVASTSRPPAISRSPRSRTSSHNAVDEPREGTFRFPVPDGAMLIGMAMEIDGKMMEGEIVEREKARAVYEKIVDEMLDPALLEWEQGNWFKLRVFPLEAQAATRRSSFATSRRWLARDRLGVRLRDRGARPAARSASSTVTVDGKVALAQRDVAQGIDLTVPVAAAKVPTVMRETRTDGVYTAVRIAPSLAVGGAVAAPTGAPQGRDRVRHLAQLAREPARWRSSSSRRRSASSSPERSVRRARERRRDHAAAAPDFVSAGAGRRSPRRSTFIEGIEPDGASDLGAALTARGALRPTDVIYIGDGIATWGEQRAGGAREARRRSSARRSTPRWSARARATDAVVRARRRTGGRAMIVKSRSTTRGSRSRRCTPARPAPGTERAARRRPRGAIVFPITAHHAVRRRRDRRGDEDPAGEPMPPSVTLDRQRSAASAYSAGGLADRRRRRRRASRSAGRVQQLAALEAADAPREEIVKLSTGVRRDVAATRRCSSSRTTRRTSSTRSSASRPRSRRRSSSRRRPTVTGGDLDIARCAPGEPVARRDPARRSGDQDPGAARRALGGRQLPVRRDQARGVGRRASAWMVRFLIDQDDRRRRLPGARDDHPRRRPRRGAPAAVHRRHQGAARSKVTATARRDGLPDRGSPDRSDGARRKDADRVEVVLPDGTVLRARRRPRGASSRAL